MLKIIFFGSVKLFACARNGLQGHFLAFDKDVSQIGLAHVMTQHPSISPVENMEKNIYIFIEKIYEIVANL